MPYQFHTVSLASPGTAQVTNASNLGIGADYNGFVMSAWFTVGAANPSASMALLTSGGTGGIDVNLTSTRVAVSAVDAANVIIGEFLSTFATSVGEFVNLLVSFDGPTHKLQCYVNDQPTGAPTGFWVSTHQIGHLATGWTVQGTGCFGDLWFQPQASFVDLSVASNRRKFINADLTPVDLGANGSAPFGTQPPLFLHVAPAGVAPDFVTNLGTGGAFSPNTITFGSCGVYPATIPVNDTAGVGDLWFGPTTTFVDLTQTANRRKFINADGSTPSLGVDGSAPFGAAPPVFLSLPQGDPASDFPANLGTGGPFVAAGPALAIETNIPPCGTTTVELPVPANTPQGADPQVILTVSDDGGRTWSELQKPRSMGKIGEYKKRIRWLKLGQFRQRIIRLVITDPVKRAFVGFYADTREGLE